MVKKIETKANPASTELVERSLLEVLAGLNSAEKNVKGRALELLAIYLAHLIDLDFEDWLMRSNASNSIEVNALAYDSRIPSNRWLIQCRDASLVDMDEIATAVGRSISFKPSVILSVTTGEFTQRARYYATKAMQLANYNILLMDSHDLQTIVDSKGTITDILSREASRMKGAKQS